MKRMFLLFLAPLLIASAESFARDRVHEFTLDNGMQVIVKVDDRAPIVVSQVWYKVGSSYEPDGITGISHVLEHMMFKGTEKYPPGEFSRIIAANGGEENAFTGRDYTAYYQQLASDRLEVSFEMEADRMRNLTLLESEFLKELEVVKEERRLRTDDKPNSLTYEQFSAVAYRSLPYANPVIGWMNDLENLRAADLVDWYGRWYAPNNATLVVVGDVEPEQVHDLAKKHFGPLKAETVPRLKNLREPRQSGMVRTVVKAPAKEPYLLMGYKTPVLTTAEIDWEPYALEVLASILDGGDSARFSRQLVRGQEVAVSAGASYSAFSRLPGMLILSGSPASGRNIEELESALLHEIQRVRTQAVSETELKRVKTQVVADQVYQLDSVQNQAIQIGLLETIGLDWRLLDEYAARINAVTADQVMTVARKYLTDEQLTVALLDPQPMDSGNGAEPAGDRHGY